MMLNAASSEPLYRQLTQLLREEIHGGKYSKGARIPSEKELSELYGVSRITVRGALEELTKENLLVRRQGKGTFVAMDKFDRDISRNTSFSAICQASGQRPGAKVLRLCQENATPEDLHELGLQQGDRVIALERLRYADDVPVSVEVSRFPPRYEFLLGENLNDCSLLELLERKYHIVFSPGHKCIELVFATSQMARGLLLPAGYPLILITSLSKDREGRPCHRSLQYIVGDRFRLYL